MLSDVRGRSMMGAAGGLNFRELGWPGRSAGGLGRRGVGTGLNNAGGRVNVTMEMELQRNVCGAQTARRSHLSDAGDAAELPLERRSNGRGHGLGTRSRQTCSHANGWEIDLRKWSDWQETKRNSSGQKNSNGDQRRGDGPSDERRGEVRGKVHLLISGGWLFDGIADVKREAASEPIECEINNRRGVKRQQLAENQAADNGDTEGPAQLRANASAERQRQAAEQRGHGGHHDGPRTKQACFIDGVERSLSFLALGFEREVNHHDGIFLDDADEQDNSDQRDDAEFRAAEKQRENRANAR